MSQHPIVNRSKWLERRLKLLEKERAFTLAKDELAAARRRLPWTPVEKDYVFDAPEGKVSLSELFAGRSQLIIYHFMFGPDAEVGCPSCSFWVDNFDGVLPHLAARDVTLVVVARGSLSKLLAFKQRMGWSFRWVSSAESDFNFDLGVSFREEERSAGNALYNYEPLAKGPFKNGPADLHGVSVFAKDAAGDVFHTYSTFGRGVDILNGAYQYLDLVPKGRDETGLPWPMAWLRYHDEYGTSA